MSILRRLLVALPVLSLAACGERGFDIYMQALKQAEHADKVDCQMMWDEASSAMVISSAKIIECKQAQEEALATIRRAQAAGFEGKDVDKMVEEIEHKLTKLSSRLRVVSYMERQMELER